MNIKINGLAGRIASKIYLSGDSVPADVEARRTQLSAVCRRACAAKTAEARRGAFTWTWILSASTISLLEKTTAQAYGRRRLK